MSKSWRGNVKHRVDENDYHRFVENKKRFQTERSAAKRQKYAIIDVSLESVVEDERSRRKR